MGKHKHKRPSNDYELTSVNITKEDREILSRIMKQERMKMGEVIRAAIRRLGEAYSAKALMRE